MNTSTSESGTFSEDAEYLTYTYTVFYEESGNLERDIAAYDTISEKAQCIISSLKGEVEALQYTVEDLKSRIALKDDDFTQRALLLRESAEPTPQDEDATVLKHQTAGSNQSNEELQFSTTSPILQLNRYLYALLTDGIVHDQLVLQKVQDTFNLFGTLTGSMEDDHGTIEETVRRVNEIREVVHSHYEDASNVLSGVHNVYGMTDFDSTDAIHEINCKNVMNFERVTMGFMEMDSRRTIQIECLNKRIDNIQLHCEFLSERKFFQQGQLEGMKRMKMLLDLTRPASSAAAAPTN